MRQNHPVISHATCSVTACIMCGCVLHNAPTGTAPALKAVSAVSDGQETPTENRWRRHSRRSSTPVFFLSMPACLCQERPRSPPPLGRKHRLIHVFSYSTMSVRCEKVPDVAEGQSPALLQEQPALWAELHVQILAVSTVNVDKQGHRSQLFHRYSVKQRHWHTSSILERSFIYYCHVLFFKKIRIFNWQ